MSKHLDKRIVILLHTIAWLIFFFSAFINFPLRFEFEKTRVIMHIIFTSSMISLFYFIYFYLFPKFFNKSNIILFFGITFTIIVILSFFVDYSFTTFIKNDFKPNNNFEQFQKPPIPQNPTFNQNFPPPPPGGPKRNPFQGILFFSLMAALSISFKATSEWFKSEQIKKELENDKLKAELTALKAQINPHFFFNVMNNLCSLARKKSDKTEEYIIKLSQIMRYSFSNVNQDFVSLEKELEFIKDYIEVLKLSYPEESNIILNIAGNPENYKISPMILFAFIENAFKHGSISTPYSYINISIEITKELIKLEVLNTISTNAITFEQYSSGTGIENTQKRLNLLYPNSHELTINKDHHIFHVLLKINLQ